MLLFECSLLLNENNFIVRKFDFFLKNKEWQSIEGLLIGLEDLGYEIKKCK